MREVLGGAAYYVVMLVGVGWFWAARDSVRGVWSVDASIRSRHRSVFCEGRRGAGWFGPVARLCVLLGWWGCGVVSSAGLVNMAAMTVSLSGGRWLGLFGGCLWGFGES